MPAGTISRVILLRPCPWSVARKRIAQSGCLDDNNALCPWLHLVSHTGQLTLPFLQATLDLVDNHDSRLYWVGSLAYGSTHHNVIRAALDRLIGSDYPLLIILLDLPPLGPDTWRHHQQGLAELFFYRLGLTS